MAGTGSATGTAALRAELHSIAVAVRLVASGDTRRVTVAGLHFGEALLEPARQMAADQGVRIVPLWTADEAGLDIQVEGLDVPGGGDD